MIEDLGSWLKAQCRELDQREAAWLRVLAEFDLTHGWWTDGSTSCAAWLIWHAKLPRATAFEKLRVAHELRRRPLLSEAFQAGRVSYSAVRILTRVTDPDPDVDAALITVAETGTIADVERAVRCYRLHLEQEREPSDPCPRRGLWIKRFGDGTARVEVTLTDLEADELAATLQAIIDISRRPPVPVDESPRGDTHPAEPAEPVDESPHGDAQVGCLDPVDPAERRADAFMDLLRIARSHLGDDPTAINVKQFPMFSDLEPPFSV